MYRQAEKEISSKMSDPEISGVPSTVVMDLATVAAAIYLLYQPNDIYCKCHRSPNYYSKGTVAQVRVWLKVVWSEKRIIGGETSGGF